MRFAILAALTISAMGVLSIDAQGQIFFQNAVGLSDASDISRNGTPIDAVGVDHFGSTPIAIGDLTFNPIFDTADTTITINNAGGGTDGSGSTATPYQTVLDGVAYAGFSQSSTFLFATVTLNNLTINDEYQVQVFNGGGRNTAIIGSDTVDIADAYTIGTFTATSSSESFTFQAATNPGDAGEIGAIALREIPEPSTWALLLSGAIIAGLFFRGRSAVVR